MPVKSTLGVDLLQIETNLRNMRPVAKVVATEARKMVRASFAKRKGPDGQVWMPLAKSTRAARKPGEGRRALSKTRVSRQNTLVFARGASVIFQLPAVLLYHQRGKGRMHRPVLPLFFVSGRVIASAALHALILKTIDDHVLGNIRKRRKRQAPQPAQASL